MSIDFEKLFPNLPKASRAQRRPVGRWWTLVLGAFLFFTILATSASVYVDGLWFASLGQTAVFRTRILAPFALFLVVFAASMAWFAANWLWAMRPQSQERVEAPVPRQVALLAALVLAGLIGSAAAGNWETVLLFLQRGSFGLADPLLGKDVGFYVFELPFWRLVLGSTGAWLVFGIAGSIIVYALLGALDLGGLLRQAASARGDGAERSGARRIRVFANQMSLGRAKSHLTLLAALWALHWSARQWLDRFELLYTTRSPGTFYGPGVVDATLKLPAYNFLVWLGIGLAVLILVGSRLKRPWRLVLGGIALALVVQVLLLGVLPGLVETYRVRPNELERERAYIGHNITFTRAAYGLSDVQRVSYSPNAKLTAAVLDKQPDTRKNIRLWDWRTLLTTFRQVQEFRTYYGFLDVDVDRYDLPDGPRQVMLAARELIPAELLNPTWINRHLEYTHGYGVVVSPVDEMDPRGLPLLWTRDIPTQTKPPFDREVTEPRIYFGEAPDQGYVIVGTRTDELDYPEGSANTRTTYAGRDGVSIASIWRRLLFAVHFGDPEILLSDAMTPKSKLLMYRNIKTRIEELAPFLTFDQDPYLVVTPEGRQVWMVDGYSTSTRFPYAQPIVVRDPELAIFEDQNYLRNSVKVTIDAYDGTVAFYIVDPKDPIVGAWSRVFPSLFQPATAMPSSLTAHWRYPEALFRAQTSLYNRYHMTDPGVFYNDEDRWAVPTESRSQDNETLPMEPYYATMRLRGEAKPEFLLMLPFTPTGKLNMVAWMAARCDPPNYGKLVLYGFAKGDLVYGPQQVESQIESEPEISAQLTLWSQRGSQVIRGNLLIIPIEDSLLYVEPLFLQAASNSLPELKRIIVSDGQRVVMRPTLAEALEALLNQDGATPTVAGTAGETSAGGAVPSESDDTQPAASGADQGEATPAAGADVAALPPDFPVDVPGLVRAARGHQDAGAAALARGDWLAFGREMDALQRNLSQLEQVTGVKPQDMGLEPPFTPAPAATP